MNAAWDTARDAMQQRLDALEERMREAAAAGEEITEGWLWQQERYRVLLLQADREIARLAADAAPALARHQAGYLDEGAEAAQALTHAAMGDGPAGFGVVWHQVPTDALTNLVGFASDGSPLADLIGELAAPFRDGLRQGLIEGIALGLNPRDIARRVAPGIDGFRHRILTIARTETMRAYREAARQNYQANADVVQQWRWLSAADSRTCPSCWSMHGSLHELDETLDDHPNGRCVAVPHTKSWAELLNDPSIPDTRPAAETGEALFGRLTAAEQREILGDRLYGAYADGSLDFSRLSVQEDDPRWGTMRRAATATEVLGEAA